MDGWTCPHCGRLFGRHRQSHECAPPMTLEDYFATGPAHERRVFEAVLRCLDDTRPVHVEPVSVGIFLKNPAKFAELRPRDRWVAVSFPLRRRTGHRTITRKVVAHGDRWWHVANVASPDDVDGDLSLLLAEAYDLARIPADPRPS
jgi:hypothetical protein